VVSKDVALLLELVGVDLAARESLFEYSLCFRVWVRMKTSSRTRSWTVVEMIMTV
jgi:hypothetical protein